MAESETKEADSDPRKAVHVIHHKLTFNISEEPPELTAETAAELSERFAFHAGMSSSDDDHIGLEIINDQKRTCGLKKPYLSRFASAKWYLVWYSLVLFLKSMVSVGFIELSLTSLENRYNLSESESYLISLLSDIGCILFVFPVSIYGIKGHKPIWIGMAAILMGVGCLIFSSAQLFSETYEYGYKYEKNISLCSNNSLSNICNNSLASNTLSQFRFLLYFGQVCIGISEAPMFSLGLTYIHDINNKRTCSLHVGIACVSVAIGPIVGYVLMQKCLRIYVDIKLISWPITPNDEDIWVGAWWLPFLLVGFMSILLSVPLIMFPKIKYRVRKSKILNIEDIKVLPVDIMNVSSTLRSILTSTPYIFISIASTFTSLLLSGISQYAPQFFQNVFGLTAADSTLTIIIVVVPTLIIGSFLGGILLYKLKLKLNHILIFLGAMSLFSTPFTVGFLFSCEKVKIAGVNVGYLMDNSTIGNISSKCNSHCNCGEDIANYRPSCDVELNSYFSPCFAGCTERYNIDNTYSNCSCIKSADNRGIQLMDQVCKRKLCAIFYLHIIFIAFMLLFINLRITPVIIGTMYSVKADEITMALACQIVLTRLLGKIPGPLLFSAVLNRSCFLWSKKCNTLEKCLGYDSKQFSKLYFILILVISSVNTICYIIPINQI